MAEYGHCPVGGEVTPQITAEDAHPVDVLLEAFVDASGDVRIAHPRADAQLPGSFHPIELLIDGAQIHVPARDGQGHRVSLRGRRRRNQNRGCHGYACNPASYQGQRLFPTDHRRSSTSPSMALHDRLG
jgi:hypothetical protein